MDSRKESLLLALHHLHINHFPLSFLFLALLLMPLSTLQSYLHSFVLRTRSFLLQPLELGRQSPIVVR